MPSVAYIDGVDTFARDVKRISSELPRELARHNRDIARQVVTLAERRRSRMAARYPSYDDSVTKLRPSTSAKGVAVTVRPAAAETGTRRHPVFGRWLDQAAFSRRVWPLELPGARRSVDGYLVYPTVVDNLDEIGDLYVDVIGSFARRVLA